MGTTAVDDAVKVPPVEVGRVIDGSNLVEMSVFVSLEAMDVKRGPLGPTVYNASRNGGRVVGIWGGGVEAICRC